MRIVRRHVPTDARAGQPLEHSRISAATVTAPAVLFLCAFMVYPAHADWTLGAEAKVRHDNNVGNAENSADIVEDSVIGARLSIFQLVPIAESYSLIVSGDLGGESFHRFDGLSNASIDAGIALKRKWGLGAFAPWARTGVSIARSSYDDHYRSAWVYRATLAAGQRIDDRWNVWFDYAFERRAATTHLEEEVPGLSSDAYSQNSHNLGLNVQYSLYENISLAVALLARRGDVVSTSQGDAKIFDASRALAEDPTFGPDAYAYKLLGSSYGFRVGINYAPTSHSLVGLGFERLETHAEGGNDYTKSVPEITWDYRF
jgi:hypothetical protein